MSEVVSSEVRRRYFNDHMFHQIVNQLRFFISEKSIDEKTMKDALGVALEMLEAKKASDERRRIVESWGFGK